MFRRVWGIASVTDLTRLGIGFDLIGHRCAIVTMRSVQMAKFANIRPGYVPRVKVAQPYKPKPPTEFQEAVNFASICRRHEGMCPDLKFLFAVPNGGHRNKASAGKAKAEGVKVGVPDYIWPRAVENCPGLVIELKRTKGGSLSDDQRRTLDYFASQGWTAIVCKGWQEAWEAVKAHIGRIAAAKAKVGA